MKLSNSIYRRAPWLNLPATVLVALLQRAPALRVAAVAEDFVLASPAGNLLRAVATVAALGALHSRAGATQFVQNPGNPVTGTVGQQLSVAFTVSGSPTPPNQYFINSPLPPGLTTIPAMDGSGRVPSGQVTIAGTPTQAGNFSVSVTASDGVYDETDTIAFVIAGGAGSTNSPPAVTTQPAMSQFPTQGQGASFSVSATGSPAPTIQWQRNGNDVAGATNPTLTIDDVEPAVAGVYRALLSNPSGSANSTFAILGVGTAAKVIGDGTEVARDIVFANGNVFDQVLLQGAAATVTADVGQIVRISYVDLNDDIVQIEFSGAGTLSLLLDAPSGPNPPVDYNQPTVSYMKGHAGIVITGANQNTNVSVFSVGRANAVNQALFKDGVNYDGFADIAFIAIASTDGKFGGLRTANANYFNTKGLTGLYAPGVQFQGPVFIGDINAIDNATPMLVIGGGADTRINGGDLQQANGRAVQVAGLTQLRFVTGSNSHGVIFPAQNDKGKLEQDGADVTTQVVVNPTP